MEYNPFYAYHNRNFHVDFHLYFCYNIGQRFDQKDPIKVCIEMYACDSYHCSKKPHFHRLSYRALHFVGKYRQDNIRFYHRMILEDHKNSKMHDRVLLQV